MSKKIHQYISNSNPRPSVEYQRLPVLEHDAHALRAMQDFAAVDVQPHADMDRIAVAAHEYRAAVFRFADLFPVRLYLRIDLVDDVADVHDIDIDDRDDAAIVFCLYFPKKKPAIALAFDPGQAQILNDVFRFHDSCNDGNCSSVYICFGNTRLDRSANPATSVMLLTLAVMLSICMTIGGSFCGPFGSDFR